MQMLWFIFIIKKEKTLYKKNTYKISIWLDLTVWSIRDTNHLTVSTERNILSHNIRITSKRADASTLFLSAIVTTFVFHWSLCVLRFFRRLRSDQRVSTSATQHTWSSRRRAEQHNFHSLVLCVCVKIRSPPYRLVASPSCPPPNG